MNGPLPPALLRAGEQPPTRTAGAPGAPAVQRVVWHSRFGTIEIEVVGETIFVNGEAVQPSHARE
jgi:hypothetical protein